ncbi:MAG: lipopolysaccharide assembly protein LapB [Xanthomonadales bacterium]|nr:lipopolysaccharide assembly protein LapB [Xanthomonadales bacterium]
MKIEGLVFLFIVVAALAAGWLIANYKPRKSRKQDPEERFRGHYFRGLNYLLNEQQDKAIDVFLRLAEVNQDTVETHYALGNLFRRRGEVDRAIRCHQNIIAKPGLTERQRTRALLELGEDYMHAGLLDRAERLFAELVESDAHTPSALKHLLDIYQQEKDWHKAISIAKQLAQTRQNGMGHIIANYYSILAEESALQADFDVAHAYLRQARQYNPESVRSCLLEARMAEQQEQFSDAADAYLQAYRFGNDCLPEILPALLQNLEAAGRQAKIPEYLDQFIADTRGITPVIARTRLYKNEQGLKVAAEFLVAFLRQHPSVQGLAYLIDMNSTEQSTSLSVDGLLGGLSSAQSADASSRDILLELTHQLLKNQPVYRCKHCGFSGQQHQWQCPSCKRWDTTSRIRGVNGE